MALSRPQYTKDFIHRSPPRPVSSFLRIKNTHNPSGGGAYIILGFSDNFDHRNIFASVEKHPSYARTIVELEQDDIFNLRSIRSDVRVGLALESGM
jgi:hypothetical protein